MDVLDLTGRTIIVTGASSGIGAATARLLHEAGAHPVLAARRGSRLDALSAELGGALAVRTDVTDRKDVAALAEATLERYGRIDGLVNNAGVSLHHRLDELDLDEFARVLELNVVSVVAVTQAVLPAIRVVPELMFTIRTGSWCRWWCRRSPRRSSGAAYSGRAGAPGPA